MHVTRAYGCMCLLAARSVLMVGLDGSDYGIKSGRAAVQVNVIGRDGTTGPPLFYSTLRLVSIPDMAHEASIHFTQQQLSDRV